MQSLEVTYHLIVNTTVLGERMYKHCNGILVQIACLQHAAKFQFTRGTDQQCVRAIILVAVTFDCDCYFTWALKYAKYTTFASSLKNKDPINVLSSHIYVSPSMQLNSSKIYQSVVLLIKLFCEANWSLRINGFVMSQQQIGLQQ